MTTRPDPAVNQALVQLVSQVLPVWMRHLASSRGQSEAAVGQMLAAFGQLTPLLPPGTRDAAAKVADDDPVDRMYQGFQYEDRVGQMLGLLQQDMERLLQALSCSDASLNASQWLERLQAGYVMAEQHQLHGRAADAGHEETTFF